MKKGSVGKIVLLVLLLLTACFTVGKVFNVFNQTGGSGLPNPDQAADNPTAAPELIDFTNTCDFDGQEASLQGFLRLPDDVSCTTGGSPDTCSVVLFDPYTGKDVSVRMPVSQQADPIPNSMNELPTPYGYSDLKVASADGIMLGNGDAVRITGKVESPFSGAADCELEQVSSVQYLQKLTPPTGMDLTFVSLAEAVSSGWVMAEISGNGLTSIELTLKPQVDFNLEISIQSGTLFETTSTGVQNMLVRRSTIVIVQPQIEVSLELEVSCANMELKQPEGQDLFTISSQPVSPDILKLLSQPDLKFQSLRLQQFAIWTITDNPDRYGYVGIDSGFNSGGPDDAEIQRIRDIFSLAGIDTTAYLALQ